MRTKRGVFAGLLLAIVAVTAGAPALQAADARDLRRFDIRPQALASALIEFSKQADRQVVGATDDLRKQQTAGVTGNRTIGAALDELLRGTGLGYELVGERSVRIVVTRPPAGSSASPAGNSLMLAQAPPPISAREQTEETAQSQQPEPARGIPEILVKGQRSLNTDIRRTEDDIQPYVVFDAREIAESMAPDLESFLKTRLTMNQVRQGNAQAIAGFGTWGNTSSVNLRGLGANQTLILVDGRRLPGVNQDVNVDFAQPDINGIPLSAVERIEILPSTAGGIYGGGATGGVVNIILKHDYSSVQVSTRYDDTFDGGGATRSIDASGGFMLEGGRTSVMMRASYRDTNPLYIGDRDFAARARAQVMLNAPSRITTLFSPPLGYTTNIKSVSGNPLVLKATMQSLNSPFASVPVGYAGPLGDGGAAFLGTAGQYNLDLPDDPWGRRVSLLAAPTTRSASVNLRREFTDRIEAFIDASTYDNRAVQRFPVQTNGGILPAGANNPFTEAVRLAVPLPGFDARRLAVNSRSATDQITGGLIARLPRQWTVQGEYSWNRSTYSGGTRSRALMPSANQALVDGRLNPLADVNAYVLDLSPYYYDADDPTQRAMSAQDNPTLRWDATLRVSGSLWQLPAGPLQLAALLEHHEQHTDDTILSRYSPGRAPGYLWVPEFGASTGSVYTELTAPLVSAINGRPGLRGLDLQASYRYDETRTRTFSQDVLLEQLQSLMPSPDGPFPDVPYDSNRVNGNQYTLGARYRPVDSLAFRVSYGEGILPPSPAQFSTQNAADILDLLGLTDPLRDGEAVTSATVQTYTNFGSLLLRPERSRSWSGGLIFTPLSLPELRVSVDYTRISKIDEITTLGDQEIIDQEGYFPGHVVRDPLTPADQALGYTGGVIRGLDTGEVNLAHSLMEAYDVQAGYTWRTRLGEFAADAMLTYQPDLAQQATPESARVDKVGYSDGPLEWRATTGLRFSRGALSLGWNMQYYDRYRVYSSTNSPASRDLTVLAQGAVFVPTQTYHDLFAGYRFGQAAGFAGGVLDNTELLVSIQNVFDRSPPILAALAAGGASAFSGYSTDGDPRLRRYSISIRKAFGK